MIDFTITTALNSSPREVFAYITDPDLLPSWQTNTISSVLEGPRTLGVGAQLREVHRAPGGKKIQSLVEVSEYEPDRVFGLRVIEGTPIHLRILLEPAAHTTAMTFRAYGSLTGAVRIIEPLVGRMLQRQFRHDCATLQRVVGNEMFSRRRPDSGR
jgi:uncharacterized protein YndB with AHSA1/START domain